LVCCCPFLAFWHLAKILGTKLDLRVGVWPVAIARLGRFSGTLQGLIGFFRSIADAGMKQQQPAWT
jgi:hypothetical protein